MPVIGPLVGMGMHVSAGAKRYVDVMHDEGGSYANGKTYTSKPKKLVGPIHEMTHPHLLGVNRQEAASSVLGELTGVAGEAQASQALG